MLLFWSNFIENLDAFMGRQHYVLLAVGPQAVSSQRRRLLPIVFGIVLGYFLGVSITYESESDVENVIRSTYGSFM